MAKNIPVEVEGGEAAQLPMGGMIDFNGPSHENGGMPVSLPEGTMVFSDRISVEGKTMAERKKNREKKFQKMANKLGLDPTNVLVRNTAQRTSIGLEQEEQMDIAIQQSAEPMMNTSKKRKKMAGGGLVMPQYQLGNETNYPLGYGLPLNSFQPSMDQVGMFPALNESDAFKLNRQLSTPDPEAAAASEAMDASGTGMPIGNIVGTIGTAVNAVAPLITTLANRRQDKPNINPYLGYGIDALATNTEQQDLVNIQKQASVASQKVAANTAKMRNRNSAQGIGTQRALDSVTDLQSGLQAAQVDATYANQLNSVLGQRGQLQNMRDEAVARGEYQRDLGDRQDADQFYSNLNQDLGNFGTSVQSFGRNLNQQQRNNDELSLINELSKYGLGYKRKRGKLEITKVK